MQKMLLFLVMYFSLCLLHAQDIILPVLGKDSTDLSAYVSTGFSFAGNGINAVDVFPEFKTGYCSNSGGCFVLPVRLLKFSGERKDTATVLLQWETDYEINNKGYDVECSFSKPDMFYKAAFVPAKGGHALKNIYRLTDSNNYSGTSFYRLKLIDGDSSFTYSNVIAIKGYTAGEKLLIYPNPANTIVGLNIISRGTCKAAYIITDASGKPVMRGNFYLQKGVNNLKLSVSQLSAGLYKIKILREDLNPLLGMFVKY